MGCWLEGETWHAIQALPLKLFLFRICNGLKLACLGPFLLEKTYQLVNLWVHMVYWFNR